MNYLMIGAISGCLVVVMGAFCAHALKDILDDYGNPNNTNIRNSIDDKVREGKINIHKKIGEDVGFLTKSGWKMIDREGVICKV